MRITTAVTPTNTRRAGVWGRSGRTIAGVLLLLVGAALLVLPGPGLLVIAAGLAVLAVDYPWARRLLDRVRARLAAARQHIPGPPTTGRTTRSRQAGDRADGEP